MPTFGSIHISEIVSKFRIRRSSGAVVDSALVWVGSATTSGGVATFNPTDDGTPTGNALFSEILAVMATASRNTETATDVELASVKLVSADLKTITVNVVDGVVLGILGATVVFSPDGTAADILVIGVPA